MAVTIESHEINGHSVRIVKGVDTQELWIDDSRQKFLAGEEGYRIGYIAPQESLVQAVKAYLDLLPEQK